MNIFSQQICVSIVSHGHGQMVVDLLEQLFNCSEVGQVVLTFNTQENLALPEDPRLLCIFNQYPSGFGTNHNKAFLHSFKPYFCVLNPDVNLTTNPFTLLLGYLKGEIALCAPAVISPNGITEDSARRFPSIKGLFFKILGISDGRYFYNKDDAPFFPDWVGGMFMLLSKIDYEAMGGFDEKYFLYYEDVDLCVRLQRSGRKILLCPQIEVVHAAQRSSHKRLRHMVWHLCSMFRYFTRYLFRLPKSNNGP